MSSAWQSEKSFETGSSKSKVLLQNHLDHLQTQHHLEVMGQNVTGRLQDGFSKLLRTQRERINALPKRDIPFPHNLDSKREASSSHPDFLWTAENMLVHPSLLFTFQ